MSADPEDHDAIKAAHKAQRAQREAELLAKFPDIGPYLEAEGEFSVMLLEWLGERDADVARLESALVEKAKELERVREALTKIDMLRDAISLDSASASFSHGLARAYQHAADIARAALTQETADNG